MTEETLKETLAQAVWICHPDDGEDHPLVPVFKKAFTVKQGLRRGRLTLTAHGIYEAKINGKAVTEDRFTPGQVVRLKHGEGLDLEGAFSTANCDGGREHFQEITYICKGCAEEEYTPHFAVFGFRYALLTGIEGGDFTAVAVYSDMEETGDFQCSNPLINRLVENARWSQKGNFSGSGWRIRGLSSTGAGR